ITDFTPRSTFSFVRRIYHLATARYVFVDNYHVVLAACNFRPAVKCIQVWHANGAVKYYGFRDKTIKNRPDSAHRRFKKVYSRFHHITVSSDEMAYIFKEAFGADDSRILKTGVPRIDFFSNVEKFGPKAKKFRRALLALKVKNALP